MSHVNDAITDTTILVESIYRAQIEAFGPLDYQFLIEIIEQNKVSNVLDIGTGEGSFLIGLAAKTPSVCFEAIDLNENLIEQAKLTNNQTRLNINFQHANFGDDYPGSDYDLIMARFAIEHIKALTDIDSFIVRTHKRLKATGWLVLIEYYVQGLDVDDPVWEEFRKNELATYKIAGAHPRICLRLPYSLGKAEYKNIRSVINHISPNTIGSDAFYNLVMEYTKLYCQIAPQLWTDDMVERILTWADKKQATGEPAFFTSYTIGKK